MVNKEGSFDIIIRCRQCGSENVEVVEEDIYVEYEFAYVEKIFTCKECGNSIKN